MTTAGLVGIAAALGLAGYSLAGWSGVALGCVTAFALGMAVGNEESRRGR